MANITETANLCGLKRENFQTTKLRRCYLRYYGSR